MSAGLKVAVSCCVLLQVPPTNVNVIESFNTAGFACTVGKDVQFPPSSRSAAATEAAAMFSLSTTTTFAGIAPTVPVTGVIDTKLGPVVENV